MLYDLHVKDIYHDERVHHGTNLHREDVLSYLMVHAGFSQDAANMLIGAAEMFGSITYPAVTNTLHRVSVGRSKEKVS